MIRFVIFALILLPFRLPGEAVDQNILRLAREHMRAYLTQVPDYVCRVNVTRYQGTGRKKQPLHDRLRLEIAFVGGFELYALPGATSFAQVPLQQLTGQTGAISTGSYAQHLREIFLAGRPDFTAAGIVRRGNRDSVRIDFSVPRERSRFALREGGTAVIAGYSGTVYLTPGTFQIEELEVRVSDVPAKMNLEKSREVTLYRPVRIGDRELPLASTGDLTLSMRNGIHARNAVTFENCRRYGVESTMSFDALPEGTVPPVAPTPAAPLIVPPGTALTLALETPINQSTAIGDQVTLRVAEQNRILPKGAAVTGRITRMSRREDRRGTTWRMVAMRLEAAESGGRHGELRARLEVLANNLPSGMRNRYFVADLDRQQPGEGGIAVQDREFPIRPGLRMVWIAE